MTSTGGPVITEADYAELIDGMDLKVRCVWSYRDQF
jgi:hypothetical protein